MDHAISWLVRLGVEQELFTLEHAQLARHAVGEQANLLAFAQHLIDEAYVDDERLGELEKLAGMAQVRGADGPPDEDAWSEPEPEPPPAADPVAPRVASASAAVSSAPIEAGDLDFEQIGGMDDDTLATKLRGLLVLCGDEGVSDLHMCAGAMPFVRKERALSPISEHTLTEEEAMRLNTVLLAPH